MQEWLTAESVSVIKVSGHMYSKSFEKRLGCSFTMVILPYSHLVLLFKSFVDGKLIISLLQPM